MKRLIVAIDTPACLATSRIVTESDLLVIYFIHIPVITI